MKSPVERILPSRETSKDILTPSARILLSHNSSWSQGGCWGALLRRNALPQNCIGRRRPCPCCNPLRHLSQVEQLFCVNEIHSDEIHFSIFKKRKRTSFYPRLAIAYSLIVLIIIIRFSHCQYHRMKCNDISRFSFANVIAIFRFYDFMETNIFQKMSRDHKIRCLSLCSYNIFIKEYPPTAKLILVKALSKFNTLYNKKHPKLTRLIGDSGNIRHVKSIALSCVLYC